MKLVKRMSGKAALPPGSLVYVGTAEPVETLVHVVRYGPGLFERREAATLSGLNEARKAGEIRWLQVHGVHSAEAMEQIGQALGLDKLVLEDIMNTTMRPKYEDCGAYLFLAAKLPVYSSETMALSFRQCSLVLGRGFLASFEEGHDSDLAPIEARIAGGRGVIRGHGPDYLAYALLDLINDSYYQALETMSDSAAELDEMVLTGQADQSVLESIYLLKRATLALGRMVRPFREAVHAFSRRDSHLVGEELDPYLRDLSDHVVHVYEAADNLRDMMSSLMDLYLNTVSNRMNQVMKVLTIIATIFIPLTFLAGVYGMNFKYMPELDLPWAYPVLLLVMAVLALGMLGLFIRKKWL